MSQNHEKCDFYDLILNTSYFILHSDVGKCKFDYILNTLNLIPHT